MFSLPTRKQPPAYVVEDAVSNHDALETAADALQTLLKGAEAVVPDAVLDLLHGESVGHPVHPLLVHLPLGGWVIAAVLDHLPAKSPGANDHAADVALTLGTLGAVPTIATGWLDWSNTRGEARRTGLIHGALNETAFLLNVGSLVARRRGRRGLGKALSGAALGLAVAGGFLGGELVYRHGLGVGRTLAHRQG
ncbi:putative membrane protein [Deinococcus metalli]|uniref:Putative membrane protein n=1 Tax=Deinococcus metalli TaxID=1141878 RepID=A0A7W8KDA0_9DEIO|nr:DUF2231 domain-containing protein [Deinococcus metalli]MBB5376044.1 putative membrane protein [Deinococcus metalli]GHF41242.1 hypothetical protein GCM10017781_17400 [Deinococcus metalli]